MLCIKLCCCLFLFFAEIGLKDKCLVDIQFEINLKISLTLINIYGKIHQNTNVKKCIFPYPDSFHHL